MSVQGPGPGTGPWFPALRLYVEQHGYEVVTMGDGERSAVPMSQSQPLIDLDHAVNIAVAAEAVASAPFGQISQRDFFKMREALTRAKAARSHPRGDE